MSLPKLFFDCAGLTDVGVRRKNNEDAFGIWIEGYEVKDYGESVACSGRLDRSLLLIVADGMGGAEAGEVASHYAVKESIRFWQEILSHKKKVDPNTITELWQKLLGDMQDVLKERALNESTKGLATTFTGLLVVDEKVYWAQCGDSRLYRLRDGTLEIVTPDQSPVGKLFQMGEITEEQARKHPYRNLLDQCLGGDDDEPFIPEFGEIDFMAGDSYLLCSDGVMDGVWNKEIAACLQQAEETGSEAAVKGLIDQAKAQSGKDNITGVVFRISDEPLEEDGVFTKMAKFFS